MARQHLRSAIPAFGIPQGEDAAIFRSLMTWLQNCGYDDKEREQIWDAFAAYNQQRPTGMPFNKQALQWHIENTFDEHAAEAVIGWHAISRSVVQTASQRLRERLLAYGAIAFVAVAAGWRGADAPRDDP